MQHARRGDPLGPFDVALRRVGEQVGREVRGAPPADLDGRCRGVAEVLDRAPQHLQQVDVRSAPAPGDGAGQVGDVRGPQLRHRHERVGAGVVAAVAQFAGADRPRLVGGPREGAAGVAVADAGRPAPRVQAGRGPAEGGEFRELGEDLRRERRSDHGVEDSHDESCKAERSRRFLVLRNRLATDPRDDHAAARGQLRARCAIVTGNNNFENAVALCPPAAGEYVAGHNNHRRPEHTPTVDARPEPPSRRSRRISERTRANAQRDPLPDGGGVLATGGLTACGDDKAADPGTGGNTKKAEDRRHPAGQQVLGPLGDRGPQYLEAAFKAAGVDYDIQNAQGDKAAFQTIADQMITGGVNVLMIVNLDSGTGKAVLDKAKAAASRPSTTTG